jgi:hypothetical protein
VPWVVHDASLTKKSEGSKPIEYVCQTVGERSAPKGYVCCAVSAKKSEQLCKWSKQSEASIKHNWSQKKAKNIKTELNT